MTAGVFSRKKEEIGLYLLLGFVAYLPSGGV